MIREQTRAPSEPAEPDRTGYRPVRAIGLLLLLEVAALAALGLFEFSRVDWREVVRVDEMLPPRAVQAAAMLLFVPPAALTLVSALGFLLLRRRGWLLAAISQGAMLAVCLWLYTELAPYYVYPVMAVCILLVLYLNSQSVRSVFHRESDREHGHERAPLPERGP